MKRKLFALIAAASTVIAAAVASSACLWILYQPEEPECLSEK